MEQQTDVVVIGAGPVGLFAVFQCGMQGLQCHVIDSLEMIGGQCTALYPEKPIYDIPAYPTIEAAELIARLEEQAAVFQPTYHLSEQVVGLERLENGRLRLTTSKKTIIEAGAVIIAAGVGAFGPNRPPLENIEAYEGHSVFYMVKQRQDFAGKKLVIAGGGDSAVDWAISLSALAEEVMLVHRRDKFRAAPESVYQLNALVKQGKIRLVTPCQLHGLTGENGQLQTVEVADMDGNITSLAADILLPFFGLSMNLGPILEWDLALEKNHIAVQQASCQTNITGVYAVGDIAHYEGKLKLILTGFAEAASAAHAIYGFLCPNHIRHFEYSTSKGVPGFNGAAGDDNQKTTAQAA
ncbi:MAG: NAD(P)/FAD-dependent oxidoreductase [Alphaproteobacteria bacterium]